MKKTLLENIYIEELLKPETDLEHQLLRIPAFVEGLLWGVPRFGHPEGKVLFHIREVLDNIDQIELPDTQRQQLRLITFVHDTFKYQESKSQPRDWSKHHSILARQFLETFTDDPVVLDITELHDEAYYAWRLKHLYRRPQEGDRKLSNLLHRVRDCIQTYYLFFKSDTRTGDKNQSPLMWFEETVPGIEIVDF